MVCGIHILAASFSLRLVCICVESEIGVKRSQTQLSLVRMESI